MVSDSTRDLQCLATSTPTLEKNTHAITIREAANNIKIHSFKDAGIGILNTISL
ncbi:hypothetical protein DPMN_046094 [Dreissena polymorpha]|uniref:Uncharacterized protein n=1 Tax=Dreissena polymorpha TaxID=45954 RepID=A0A9D4D649_DREPO|nr:hypothetical protein DPMN_046094 [Dreissena polymorpha]